MTTLTTEIEPAEAKRPPKPETDDCPTPAKAEWRSFPKVPNLLQYVRTGTYFARTKVQGKTFRASLETKVLTTAKLRLADKLKEFRKPKPVLGTFADARAQYEAELAQDHALGDGTRYYRKNCLKALAKTWPELDGMALRAITASACKDWASRFAASYDEQYFNNTLGSLRAILPLPVIARPSL